jgi:sugar-specific transcriptional regulator TrmB
MSRTSYLTSPYSKAVPTNGADEIAQRLTDFGLDEKEAQLYVHLLKYGPKRASELARSLKTYRLDVYRNLAGLAGKEMINTQRESPAVYTALDLSKALDNVLISRHRELHSMEEMLGDLVMFASNLQAVHAESEVPPTEQASDEERCFIEPLNAFGFNEKEAQLYVHLLKYGPKRANELARLLNTYREDVYRRRTRLINAGVVAKTAGDVPLYAPIKLETALNDALAVHQKELHRLQLVKRDIVEDATGALSQVTVNAHPFKMLKTVGEVMTAISQLINSAEVSILFLAHPRFDLISMGGFLGHLKCASSRDVHVRGAFDISPQSLAAARRYLSVGVELRHVQQYNGITMVLADGKRSVSLIKADLKVALSLDESVAAIWSNDVAQAQFLTNAFETTWERASCAQKRVAELSQQEHLSKQVALRAG